MVQVEEVGSCVAGLESGLGELGKAVEGLGGAELSEREQLARIEALQAQIQAKDALIQRYKDQGLAILD